MNVKEEMTQMKFVLDRQILTPHQESPVNSYLLVRIMMKFKELVTNRVLGSIMSL
jgi:hypothetical protein